MGESRRACAFISKAKRKHGTRFDYSHVSYVNTATSVNILCNQHNLIFSQHPKNHLRGAGGCPMCNNSIPLDTDTFISKAMGVHNSMYTYSDVVYERNNIPVTITCQKHGNFSQLPSSHLSGQGCPRCGGNHVATTATFIQDAQIVHGNTYDYSKSIYKSSKDSIDIVCNIHGKFVQSAGSHLQGHGCKLCGIIRKQTTCITTTEFIVKSNIVHNFKYKYVDTEYHRTHHKVRIQCPIHGIFLQAPYSHLQGLGCGKCGIVNKTKTTKEFVKEAIATHGNYYDYSDVDYVKCNIHVHIGCNTHGVFKQTPTLHLQGYGCSKCSKSGISKLAVVWLDQLSATHQIDIQHGLNGGEFSIPTTRYKVDGYCEETNTVYEFYGDYWHGNPNTFNPHSIHPTYNVPYSEVYDKTILREDTIRQLGFNIVTMWESDFILMR